jgi:aminoglycoside phosphotransferase (APT) family kinase protein
MLPGTPHEARWIRLGPRRTLPREMLDRMVHTAFSGSRIVELQPLGDGLRNANFKLRLDGQPEPVVLRIYEHDASLCRKELDLFRLAGGSVPVPEVIHAEPHGLEDLPPFTLARYVEGISLRDLRRNGDTGATAEAAYSAGETLAAIGRYWEFAVSGSPLGDVGNFLRHERASRPLAEPHFSAGYLHGGGSRKCWILPLYAKG